MQTRRLGRTDLEVTTLSFGAAGIGNLYRPVSRQEAEATLAVAWDAGVRYFDTAPRYGHGLSERRLGDFLRDYPRESYVISTKVGRLLAAVPEDQVPDYGFADPLPFRADYDYSYDGIMRSVEFSLARLGTNRVEILYVHDIGVLTHGEEENARHFRDLMDGGMKALDELKSSGAGQGDRPRRQRDSGLPRRDGARADRLHPARRPLHAARPERRAGTAGSLRRDRHDARHRRRVQFRHPRRPAPHQAPISTMNRPRTTSSTASKGVEAAAAAARHHASPLRRWRFR